MKKLKLMRQSATKPDMKYLDEMRNYLEELFQTKENFSSEEWKNLVHQLISFQAEDGGFNLLDSYAIETDCAIYYCYEPTYICTALLIEAFLRDQNLFTGKEDIILKDALKACCVRQLRGHGFDWFRDLKKAIHYFVVCDVKTFLQKYPDFCKEFSMMFASIKNYLFTHMIFVYGTLMKGQPNHHFLRNSEFVDTGKISGFEMYDLGHFPGIISGNGTVYGEVYLVSDLELEKINRLEGEGDLYIKTEVEVLLGTEEKITASVYVYNHSIKNCERLYGKYGSEKYVWYVSYGSNLLEERLKFYIQGGYCKYNSTNYKPCTDTTLPVESRPVLIPYNMYYSNYAEGSWKNSAVSFLDLSKRGMSYGRAYKIKKSQLNEIHGKEGKGEKWYPECVQLDSIDGLETYTFSNYNVKKKEPFSRVSAEYGIVLFKGMKESYPNMSDDEIFEYLRMC